MIRLRASVGVDLRLAWLGAVHAPSPDVRSGPPGLRSLGGAGRSGILPALGTYAGSWGMGSPSLIADGETRGVRPGENPDEPVRRLTRCQVVWPDAAPAAQGRPEVLAAGTSRVSLAGGGG